MNPEKETNVLVKRNASLKIIHGVLIVFGFYILIQDLIAENLYNSKTFYQVIKYADEAFYPLLFFVILTIRLSSGKTFRPTNIDLLLVAFLFFAIVSSIVARVPIWIVASQLILYLKCFFLFYIFTQIGLTAGILKNYVTFFFWTGVLFLVFGIIDFMIPLQFRTFIGHDPGIEYRNGFPAVKSLTVHPVYFSWFMNLIALFCFAFFLNSRRVGYLISGLIFTIGSISAQRVKAIAGLIIGIIVGLLFVSEKKYKSNRILLFLSILMLLLVFLPAVISLFENNIGTYLLSENIEDIPRDALYLTGFKIANDFFPFGAGIGRFASYTSKVYYSPIYDEYGLSNIFGLSEDSPLFISDTFWPMVMGETGWFGCVLYLVILIVFIFTITGYIKNTDDKSIRVFYLGTLMVLIESLVESIAQPIYVAPPANFFVFGVIGLSYSLHRHTRRTESIETKA